MPQFEYLGQDDLPEQHQRAVFLRGDDRWHIVAVLIHYDRTSGQETGRTAFLRRVDGRGAREWELPWDLLNTKAATTT
ncbi:hypothetical protein [Streptomyces sp. NBC_01304]|uniref:hypothetical protein n=1 Tax=Streptomyces sp. NBC_01304 TaxID=2903818 RepID=UPI002E15EEC0|nr:hypothetical protein OG430_49250 [Streptomyces sp. NBC_01304]